MSTQLAQSARGAAAHVGHVVHPSRPLNRKYMQALVYLIDRIAAADRGSGPMEKEMVGFMVGLMNMQDYRSQPWFKRMTDQEACRQLDTETAKLGALAAMTLVLKADEFRQDMEHKYLDRIREMLQHDVVVVPKELESHKKLVQEYLKL